LKKRLTVAKYTENIEWVDKGNSIDGLDSIIYNKLNDLSNHESYRINDKRNIDLFNIGREAHTYIWHIVNNYENLYDIEIFAQGRIDDTISVDNFWESIENISEDNFSGYMEFSPCVKHIAFDVAYWDEVKSIYPESIHVGYYGDSEKEFFHRIYEKIPENKYYTTRAHAIFAVSKELILRHPKEKYIKLLESCNPTTRSSEEIISFPYKMEHFWNLLFTHTLD
jgi:hypothetical protein